MQAEEAVVDQSFGTGSRIRREKYSLPGQKGTLSKPFNNALLAGSQPSRASGNVEANMRQRMSLLRGQN